MTTALEPRSLTVTLLQGPDEERLRDLRTVAEGLRPDSSESRTDSLLLAEDLAEDEYEAAITAANNFAVEAEERGVTLSVRALRRKQWRALVEKHPPRDGNQLDQARGVNIPDFMEALVPLSITSPVMGVNDLEDFLDSLSDRQFEELGFAAWDLNRHAGVDPKELLPSGRTET